LIFHRWVTTFTSCPITIIWQLGVTIDKETWKAQRLFDRSHIKVRGNVTLCEDSPHRALDRLKQEKRKFIAYWFMYMSLLWLSILLCNIFYASPLYILCINLSSSKNFMMSLGAGPVVFWSPNRFKVGWRRLLIFNIQMGNL
jgi:hypothetical protein